MRGQRLALGRGGEALSALPEQRMAQLEPLDREVAGAARRRLGALQELAPGGLPATLRGQLGRGRRRLPRPMLRLPVAIHRRTSLA